MPNNSGENSAVPELGSMGIGHLCQIITTPALFSAGIAASRQWSAWCGSSCQTCDRGCCCCWGVRTSPARSAAHPSRISGGARRNAYYAEAIKIVPAQPHVLSNLGLSYALSKKLPRHNTMPTNRYARISLSSLPRTQIRERRGAGTARSRNGSKNSTPSHSPPRRTWKAISNRARSARDTLIRFRSTAAPIPRSWLRSCRL
jgi:hypothetical protein